MTPLEKRVADLESKVNTLSVRYLKAIRDKRHKEVTGNKTRNKIINDLKLRK